MLWYECKFREKSKLLREMLILLKFRNSDPRFRMTDSYAISDGNLPCVAPKYSGWVKPIHYIALV